MDNAEEYWITVRGATKLDGARGKKQVWRPYVRTWVLSEANVLHWSSCDIVRTFRRPQSFGALIVIRSPGNCAPCPSSLRPWLLCAATPLIKSWYTALTRGIRELWALGGVKFQFARIFAPLSGKTNRRILQDDGSVSETCPKISGSFSWIFLILYEYPPTSYAYSFDVETLAKY